MTPAGCALLDRACKSLDDEGCKILSVELAATCTDGATLLRQIYLHANSLSSSGAEYLAAASLMCNGLNDLSRLCLHENNIGDRGASALFHAMQRGALPGLTWLNLASNAVGDAGAEALAALLESGTPLLALREISLAANLIREAGCSELIRCSESASSSCPQLESINVRANRIPLEAVADALDGSPLSARLLGASLREQLGDSEEHGAVEGGALDGGGGLDAAMAELEPLVELRAAEVEATRAAEAEARVAAEEAARIMAEETALREAAEAVAAAEREAAEEDARAAAAAELAAAGEGRMRFEAEARQVAAAQLAAAYEEERLETARRERQYEVRMARRQALEEQQVEAEEVARRLAAEARRVSSERATRDAAEKARRADAERERRAEREAHRRMQRESSVAASVAKGADAKAREAQAELRRLESLQAKAGSRAEAAKQNSSRQEARQQLVREEERRAEGRRTEDFNQRLMMETRRADALGDAARKATAARKAAERGVQHTPMPRAHATTTTEPSSSALPPPKVSVAMTSAAAAAAPKRVAATPRPRARSAPPARQLMLANEPKGVGGVRPADVKGILKGNSSSPGSPRTTSPPPHVEGDEAPASPTTNEASRTRTVRFLGESRMGTTFPTRDAPRKSRAGRPASAEAPAVLSARSPRRSEGAKPEAVAPRQSFLVQPCGGHTGTDFVREALLRRGWAEVPGARDSQHVRRCLALSRGLKFVWLRGGDPITSDYPAKMAAVSNRWPRKTSVGGGLGLGALWAKSGLLQTLDEYYSLQGLDPWRHHPLSFRLPQGATPASPEWESFCRVFEAVADGEDARVPTRQGEKNMWLLKPTNGSCGKGIGVEASIDGLRRHYTASGGGGEWVVQKYVEAPLLFDGRKFDVRIFALLESASAGSGGGDFAWSSDLGFRLYVHREGYGRTSSEDFSLTEMHNTMHLTNFAIQKGTRHAGKHERGNCLSFGDLEKRLGSHVGWSTHVVPAMHALIADATLAARAELLDTLHAANTPHANYRTLLAFDLIVEDDGHPLLLEVNPYPGMAPQSDWHGKYLKRLMDDYVGACVDTPPAAHDQRHSRPTLDGHHVPNYRDDGWLLLLGEGRAGVGEQGSQAAFQVAQCGSRLVRRDGFVGVAPRDSVERETA